MEMSKENQRKVYHGLVTLIDFELSEFNDSMQLRDAATKKQKISNLITYARQIGYISRKGQEQDILDLERDYKTKLVEFKSIFE